MQEMKNAFKILENLEGRGYSEDVEVNRRIILKSVLQKYGITYTEVALLNIGSNSKLFIIYCTTLSVF
jgi:hypothetical protein